MWALLVSLAAAADCPPVTWKQLQQVDDAERVLASPRARRLDEDTRGPWPPPRPWVSSAAAD